MNYDNLQEIASKIREMDYDSLVSVVESLSEEEITKLSKLVGYPVFARLCMGRLAHKFVLLQDGAAAIIENDKGQILLQSRADRNKWGLPGGCQEVGESFKETIIREIKEETNLDVKMSDLDIIDIVSGSSRKNSYPNGDVVYNNTVLYLIKNYTGTLKWNKESKEMKFFDIDDLPNNQNDADLINIYINKRVRSKK